MQGFLRVKDTACHYVNKKYCKCSDKDHMIVDTFVRQGKWFKDNYLWVVWQPFYARCSCFDTSCCIFAQNINTGNNNLGN